jgi:trigger factor
MWHVTARRLQAQGLNPEQYLQITNKTEEELVTESEPDAERALRREAVLAAVIEAESIEPGDGDILEALQETALSQGQTPEKLRKRLEQQGRLDELREDLAQRRAVELLAERATPIPAEQAAAREKIWTPDKEASESEAGEGSGKLWTPGS